MTNTGRAAWFWVAFGVLLAPALPGREAAPTPAARADAVVAADGSGQYTSVQEAISRAPMRTGRNDPRWIILVKAEMSEVVRPEGWHNWRKPQSEATAFYAEYRSTGPGANPGGRVKWSRQLSEAEAEKFSLSRVVGGRDGWNPRAVLEGM